MTFFTYPNLKLENSTIKEKEFGSRGKVEEDSYNLLDVLVATVVDS